MDKNFVVKVSIIINASLARVWEALTTPELIKQYLFGTEVISDWKVGSSITYKGEWKGKSYEDKGIILQFVPEKLFESTYWSSMSGMPDVPENYKKVTYELALESGNTKLTLTQDNNATEEEKNHSEQNWKMVLDGLKKLLEKN
jgi:uncharacterized protein YndB with AHSA1/START domain